MTVIAATDQVTDAQLANYAKLIYKVTGIKVSRKKKTLLSNRIRRRLKATGITSFEAYYKQLKNLPVDGPEWDGFLQEITTHETYLFRDEGNWEWFRNTYLSEIGVQARAGQREKSLRIWSAACSTGDEACTIACCIADRLTNASQWKIDILGTDIGVDAVKKATCAEFGERSMKHVPDGYRRRFFTKPNGHKLWAAKPDLKRWTRFQQHNLLDPLSERPFDVVFLKNVLIYFDRAAKQTAIEHLLRLLKPGGVLITGAAEGVTDMLKGLDRETPWLHRSPISNKSRMEKQRLEKNER